MTLYIHTFINVFSEIYRRKPILTVNTILSTAGFDFQPGTNNLYFTFLERDWLGNNQPDDYLDYIPLNSTGKNFNWPYCHWIGQGNPDLRSPGPGNAIPDDFMVAPAEETYISNHGITNNSLTNWCQGEYILISVNSDLNSLLIFCEKCFTYCLCLQFSQYPPSCPSIGSSCGGSGGHIRQRYKFSTPLVGQ